MTDTFAPKLDLNTQQILDDWVYQNWAYNTGHQTTPPSPPLPANFKIDNVNDTGNGYYGVRLIEYTDADQTQVSSIVVVSRQTRASDALDDTGGFVTDLGTNTALKEGISTEVTSEAISYGNDGLSLSSSLGVPLVITGQSLAGSLSQIMVAALQKDNPALTSDQVQADTLAAPGADSFIQNVINFQPSQVYSYNTVHADDILSGPLALWSSDKNTGIQNVLAPDPSLGLTTDELTYWDIIANPKTALFDHFLPSFNRDINVGGYQFLDDANAALGVLPNLIFDATGELKAAYQSIQTSLQQAVTGYKVVGPDDTYDTLAASLNMPGVTGTLLSQLNGNRPLSPNDVVSVPLQASAGELLPSSNSGIGMASVYNISGNEWFVVRSQPDGTNTGQIVFLNSSGKIIVSTDAQEIGSVSTGSGQVTETLVNGGTVTASADGTTTYSANGKTYYSGSDSLNIANGSIYEMQSVGGAGSVVTSYSQGTSGDLTSPNYGYAPPDDSSNVGTFGDYQQLSTTVNSDVGLDTATGTISNIYLPTISVVNLGNVPIGQVAFNGDVSQNVAGGLVISSGDTQVIDPNINLSGSFNSSPGDIISGDYRPGNEELENSDNSLYDQVSNAASNIDSISQNLFKNAPITDYSLDALSFIDTDPLLIDISGKGISVSNWINNNVYFDTNLNATTGKPDGLQHHTSWMGNGTGMLVADLNHDGQINDITETLSQYFNAGSNAGKYTDGLNALAGLAQSGATSFNATTALIDPVTKQSYWSEVQVWQDSNQNGVTDAGELQTLAQLGISSISLVGVGNQGESLGNSPVTNRASYTKTNGAVGAMAALDFQTDTTGDIATSSNGGVIINSYTEGTPTPKSSFSDQNATARTLTLNNGTLVSGGTTIGTGITAVFATTQNDTITVNATDTGTYWLGSGTATATLTGGAGNTMFLVNAKTIIHGGTGFNIAEVTDQGPISIDLKTDKLQEVIGGAGNGTFNASGTTWNVFIQGGSGNNIIIGGAAHDALAGGTGNDLIEAGPGGSVIHAGAGTDVIYGGSGKTGSTPNSDIIYGGAGKNTVILGTNNTVVHDGTGSMSLTGNSSGFGVLALRDSFSDYTFVHNTDGTITVTDDVPNSDGAVTMKNINVVDFGDIEQVNLTTGLGMPVNDQLYTSNASQVQIVNGAYVIKAATLLSNDKDYSGKTLSVRELVDTTGKSIARGSSGQVNGGTAALSSDGSTITFTPTAGFSGVYSFQYHVKDSSGNNGAVANEAGTTSTAEIKGTVFINTPAQPTDPQFDNEWFLPSIDVLPAWQHVTGNGIAVGVFDVGDNVDFGNSDLAQNAGGNFKSDGTPGIDEIGEHATLVAGVIGAARNGQGDVGVAYGATLYSESIPLHVAADNTTNPNINDWSRFAVVNNSWYTTVPFSDNFYYYTNYANAVENAATNGRDGYGTAIVFSSGNGRAAGDNTNYSNFSNSHYVITVGGINPPADIGALTQPTQNFSTPGSSILVSAPDADIPSTGSIQTSEFGQQFGANSQTVQGTSFAAPIVSGIIALMLEANPYLGARDIQTILAYTAKKTDPTDTGWSYNGGIDWNGGGLHASDDYGFGEVDAAAAVRLAQTFLSTPQTFSNESVYGAQGTGHGLATDSVGWVVPVNSGSNTPYIDANIPSTYDASNATVETQHIEVEVSLRQVRLSDLTISLVSSTGETSILLNRPTISMTGAAASIPADFDFNFDTVKDMGELAKQDYHVVVSYAPGTKPVGEIVGAAVNVYGTRELVTDANTYFYTDEFNQLSSDPNNAKRGTFSDTRLGDEIDAAATSTNDVIDLRAGSTDSVIAGRSLTIASGAQLQAAFGGAGNDTLIGNTLIDYLYGGWGNDTLTGGGGASTTFLFTQGDGTDLITNFRTGSSGDAIQFINPTNNTVYVSSYGTNGTALAYGVNSTIDLSSVAPSNFDPTNNIIGATTISYANANGSISASLEDVAATDTLIHAENIIGSNYGDRLTGDSKANVITGGAANDVIQGGGGADTLDGGGGGNYVDYAWSAASITVDLTKGTDSTGSTLKNFENVMGSNNGDIIIGDSQNNTLDGGTGNDMILGGGGSDYIDGGAGINTISYAWSKASMTVDLATSNDSAGSALHNIQNIIGSDYGDILIGDGNANVITGGAANDILQGGGGADTLDGGGGGNYVSYIWSTKAITVDLTKGTDSTGSTLKNIENIIGSNNGDSLIGDSQNNTIVGGSANDLILGGGGSDYIDGGAGVNTISYAWSKASIGVDLSQGADSTGSGLHHIQNIVGSDYGDTLTGDSNSNVITGGAANDVIQGGGGVDTLDGGGGGNYIDYVWSSKSVTVDLTKDTDSTGSTLKNFENIMGSNQGDTLIGDSKNNTIDGGTGNDTILGGRGSDYIDGGAGINTISYAWATSEIVTNLSTGTDNTGSVLKNIQNIIGSNSGDWLIGNTQSNIITGGSGNDIILGEGGADTLDGGAGINDIDYAWSSVGIIASLATGLDSTGSKLKNFQNITGSAKIDTLTGDANNNTIEGGGGADHLDGGAGINTISYAWSQAGITTSLASGKDSTGSTLKNFQNIIGSDYGDTLIGSLGKNVILGGAGNDIIEGDGGADTLNGGGGVNAVSYIASTVKITANLITGTDSSGSTLANFQNIIGSNHGDTLIGTSAANVITGGTGNDIIEGEGGADTLNGGLGINAVSYVWATTGITANLTTGTDSTGSTLKNFQNITGSNHGDTLIGSAAINKITGGSGNDTIEGMGGADTLNGGAGVNTISYAWSTKAITSNLTSGIDSTHSVISNFQNVIGSTFNDVIEGNKASNVINGGGGTNTMLGEGGYDTYQFAANDKVDTITNGISTNKTATGELDMSMNADQLWFARSGNNLVVEKLGTTQEAVIKNWYINSAAHWEELQKITSADGLSIDTSIQSLVQAMATFSAANPSFNAATTTHTSLNDSYFGTTLTASVGNSWHH